MSGRVTTDARAEPIFAGTPRWKPGNLIEGR